MLVNEYEYYSKLSDQQHWVKSVTLAAVLLNTEKDQKGF